MDDSDDDDEEDDENDKEKDAKLDDNSNHQQSSDVEELEFLAEDGDLSSPTGDDRDSFGFPPPSPLTKSPSSTSTLPPPSLWVLFCFAQASPIKGKLNLN